MNKEDLTNKKKYIIKSDYKGLVLSLIEPKPQIQEVIYIKEKETPKPTIKPVIVKKKKLTPVKEIAEKYVLHEYKQAYINKTLAPRSLPKLLELAVRYNETKEFIQEIASKANLKPEFFTNK